MSLKVHPSSLIITDRIRRMTEGNIFSLFTSAGGGGVYSHPANRVTPSFPRGVCHPSQLGLPPSFLTGASHPSCWRGGGTPSGQWGRDWDFGYPPRTTLSGDRVGEWALATRRTVCLLHSRRRTFLFFLYF